MFQYTWCVILLIYQFKNAFLPHFDLYIFPHEVNIISEQSLWNVSLKNWTFSFLKPAGCLCALRYVQVKKSCICGAKAIFLSPTFFPQLWAYARHQLSICTLNTYTSAYTRFSCAYARFQLSMCVLQLSTCTLPVEHIRVYLWNLEIRKLCISGTKSLQSPFAWLCPFPVKYQTLGVGVVKNVFSTCKWCKAVMTSDWGFWDVSLKFEHFKIFPQMCIVTIPSPLPPITVHPIDLTLVCLNSGVISTFQIWRVWADEEHFFLPSYLCIVVMISILTIFVYLYLNLDCGVNFWGIKICVVENYDFLTALVLCLSL